MYEYRVVEVLKVYDGDTCTLMVDVGFSIYIKTTIRLLGINTAELRGGTEESKEEARFARDFLKNLLSQGGLVLKTKKDKKGKYGRYLGTLHVGGVNVNEVMVEMAVAKEYMK